MNWVANEIHLVITCFVSKVDVTLLYACIGWTLKTIHALLTNHWGVFVLNIHVILEVFNPTLW